MGGGVVEWAGSSGRRARPLCSQHACTRATPMRKCGRHVHACTAPARPPFSAALPGTGTWYWPSCATGRGGRWQSRGRRCSRRRAARSRSSPAAPPERASPWPRLQTATWRQAGGGGGGIGNAVQSPPGAPLQLQRRCGSAPLGCNRNSAKTAPRLRRQQRPVAAPPPRTCQRPCAR